MKIYRLRHIFITWIGILLLTISVAQAEYIQPTLQIPPQYHEIMRLGRGFISDAAWRPGTDTFAISGNQGIWLYTSEFEDIVHLEAGIDEVHSQIIWSPRGDQFATVETASGQQGVYLWKLEANNDVERRILLEDAQRPVAWSPDGRQLATRIRIEEGLSAIAFWDAATGERNDTLPIESSSNNLAWSPDGSKVAATDYKVLQVWGLDNHEPLLIQEMRDVSGVAWSPDGNLLAATAGDEHGRSSSANSLRIWNATTGEMLRVIQAGQVLDVTWHPDGRRIATAGVSSSQIWNVDTGERLSALAGHRGNIHALSWNTEGTKLLTAGRDNKIFIWNPSEDNFRPQNVLEGHTGSVTDLSWSPDGSMIVSGSVDGGGARIWDTSVGQYLMSLQGHEKDVRSVAWSPDGSQIASGGNDRLVRIWDINTGETQHLMAGHGVTVNVGVGNPDGIATIAWSPDGTLLASGGFDASARIWQPGERDPLQVLESDGWPVTSLSWSPDGNRVYTGIATALVWDVNTGNRLTSLDCGHFGGVGETVLSPDGMLFVTLQSDASMCLWDTTTHQLINRFNYPYSVGFLAWNPVQNEIVGANDLGNIIIFDPTSGEMLTRITGHPARSAAWSPDGTLLATGGFDGTIRIWALE